MAEARRRGRGIQAALGMAAAHARRSNEPLSVQDLIHLQQAGKAQNTWVLGAVKLMRKVDAITIRYDDLIELQEHLGYKGAWYKYNLHLLTDARQLSTSEVQPCLA